MATGIRDRPLKQKFTRDQQRQINAIISGRSSINLESIDFGDSEVSTQANRTGALSEIIDIQVPSDHIYVFPGNAGVDISLTTHETFDHTTAGTLTYNLGQDFVDDPNLQQVTNGSGVATRGAPSPTGKQDLVLFGTTGGATNSTEQIAPNTVDYANNSFAYGQTGTDTDTIHAYYPFGDNSQVVGRAYTQNLESFEQVFASTARRLNVSDVYSTLEEITFRNHFALNEKEHLKFYINTSVDMANWDNTGSSAMGSDAFPLMSIPVYRIPK